MNYLEIVKKANVFSGLQGEIDSVTYVTGIQKTLTEFVNAAYLDIQLFRDNWAWMYTSGSFQWAPLSTEELNPLINRYLKVYYNNKEIRFITYDTWLVMDHVTAEIPQYFTIVPETNAIKISPVSAVVTIDYRAVNNPETLTTNTQIPKLPARFHFALVYKAAMEMGSLLGNPEVRNENATRYDMILTQLMRSQNLPISLKQRPLV